MTVFTTPDRRAVLLRHLLPAQAAARACRRSASCVTSVAQTWRERRDEVVARRPADRRGARRPGGRAVAGDARRRTRPTSPQPSATCRPPHDRRHGGFGGAPKFPPSMVLEQLLRHHARTGDADALGLVEGTCEAMARGGIYDQLGGRLRPLLRRRRVGGAALREDALRQRVAASASTRTCGGRPGRRPARRVALETADWMLRDLRTPQGGFASALDADTDGVEGLTYVWTPAQLVDVLGPDDGLGRRVC